VKVEVGQLEERGIEVSQLRGCEMGFEVKERRVVWTEGGESSMK
jgi:hypothetical protein